MGIERGQSTEKSKKTSKTYIQVPGRIIPGTAVNVRNKAQRSKDVRRQHFYPLTYSVKANALADNLDSLKQGKLSKNPRFFTNV